MSEWYTATTKILPPQQQQSSAAAVLEQLGALASGAAGQPALGVRKRTDLFSPAAGVGFRHSASKLSGEPFTALYRVTPLWAYTLRAYTLRAYTLRAYTLRAYTLRA